MVKCMVKILFPFLLILVTFLQLLGTETSGKSQLVEVFGHSF